MRSSCLSHLQREQKAGQVGQNVIEVLRYHENVKRGKEYLGRQMAYLKGRGDRS